MKTQKLITVEVYLPKRLSDLSELYRFLRESVANRTGPVVLDGFTIYEGDGAFWDNGLFEERSLVLRLHWMAGDGGEAETRQRIEKLGRILADEITPQQHQIWITASTGTLDVFEGARLRSGGDRYEI
jgi:hypothetical protein